MASATYGFPAAGVVLATAPGEAITETFAAGGPPDATLARATLTSSRDRSACPTTWTIRSRAANTAPSPRISSSTSAAPAPPSPRESRAAGPAPNTPPAGAQRSESRARNAQAASAAATPW